MAQKPNKSGQMQEYVPAGNGDASGEYADNGGSNKHFTAFGKPQNPEAINGNLHGNPVGEKPQEKQETPENAETQQFDNNDDVNKLIEKTPEERKESLSKQIKEKFEGNEETLGEMVEKVLEETSDQEIVFLDDYLEKNNSLKIREGYAGRNAAGGFSQYSNDIKILTGYAKADSHTISHEIGHSIDHYIWNNLCDEEDKKSKKDRFATLIWKDEDGKTFADALDEESGIGGKDASIVGWKIKYLSKHNIDKAKARELGINISKAYNEYGDLIVEEELDIKNYSKISKDYKQIKDERWREVNESLKKDEKYNAMLEKNSELQKLKWKAEDDYARSEHQKGNYSVTYANSPEVNKARQEYDNYNESFEKYKSELEDNIYNKMLLEKGYEQDQIEKFRENAFLPFGLQRRICNGFGGIVGDLQDSGVPASVVYPVNGHGRTYFKDSENNLALELFANMYDAYREKDQRKFNAIKKAMPKLSQKFENMLKATKKELNK